ncbi:hypothetical protein MMC09_001232 [Bachmanniomyces sp. S44760]|nr:hypothetical protein [Bachmanniomyces sp. S44760]
MCCWPFHDAYLEEPPKKKEKEKEKEEKRYIMTEPGDVFYPGTQSVYIPQPQPVYQSPPAYYHAAAPQPQLVNHVAWQGPSKAQVDAENMAIAQATGATKPVHLVPFNQSDDQQLWVRELDGSYTLRTVKDIQENLQPGYWQYAQPGGYPYFICQKKT